MLVRDIYDEAREVLANNNAAYIYRGITRAVELLAPTGLFDPLTATIDFSVDDGFFLVALPRDVKSIIKLNISNQPAFSRSRFWEFAQNSDGSVAGEEIGYSWADRGTSPIQTRAALPGVLNAIATLAEDEGKTITVTGPDADGRVQTETLTLSLADPVAGEISFSDITFVRRDETVGDVVLQVGSSLVARYYGDETEPRYRLIKLSKSGVTCRMVYRRHTYKIRSLDDVIPLDSPMGVTMMLDAVGLYWKKEYDAADAAVARAVRFVQQEQKSREEHIESSQTEAQSATNQNIATLDVVIVADVYDKASECAGPVGRQSVFDSISSAVETLSRKGQWDALLGVVDVWKPARPDTVSQFTGYSTGDGLFTLPRFVETPMAVNVDGRAGFPRNGWFQFHLNGGVESARSDCGTWDDMGQVCIISPIPFDVTTHKKIATQVCAVPDISGDDATAIKIFGIERLSDGKEVRIVRNGIEGWTCPCVNGSLNPGANAPDFVEIDRISKGASTAFIKLVSLTVTPAIPEVVAVPEQTIPRDETLTHAGGIPGFNYVPTVTGGDVLFEQDGAPEDKVYYFLARGDDGGVAGFHLYEMQSDGSALDIFFVAQNIMESATVHADIGDFTVPDSFFDEGAIGILKLVITHQVIIPAIEYVAPVPAVYVENELLGYWYPDELSPTYRQIKVPKSSESRIRVKFRKRSMKVDSMFSPLQLRSRQAIEAQLMAQKAGNAGDIQGLEMWEQKATQYLKEEQAVNRNPGGFSLQFDESTMPGISDGGYGYGRGDWWGAGYVA